jgi:hypothetical protein
LAESGAVEILSQVYQGQKCIQDARLYFIGEVHPAGGYASQVTSLLADVLDDFDLAFAGSRP